MTGQGADKPGRREKKPPGWAALLFVTPKGARRWPRQLLWMPLPRPVPRFDMGT